MCICLCVLFCRLSPSGRDLLCVYVCVYCFVVSVPVVEICYVYMFVCVVLSSQSSGRYLLCVYVCVCGFVISVQW